jgi:RNA polymerase sigma-70 factor (ECF subfamily)
MPASLPAGRDARLRALLDQRARFLSFVERRVGSRELAEEVLQEAFVRSVETVDGVRDDEAVVPWFFRVLRNAVAELHRRRAARDRATDALAGEAAVLEAGRREEKGELCACFSALLPELKPEYADAVRTVDLEGATVAELADKRGITVNNATVRLHRARQALGRELRVACGACADHGCLDCGCKKS